MVVGPTRRWSYDTSRPSTLGIWTPLPMTTLINGGTCNVSLVSGVDVKRGQRDQCHMV